ncbi:MAG: hypothetical protein ABIB71_02995 [Candidatus Woesearchaeota archaeon]
MGNKMHPKLEEIGVTEERLEKMGVGAILYQSCPDCEEDIFCTVQGEYYKDWKEQGVVPILLWCQGCKTYKSEISIENGQVLYEKEGEVEERGSIPLIERVKDLP